MLNSVAHVSAGGLDFTTVFTTASAFLLFLLLLGMACLIASHMCLLVASADGVWEEEEEGEEEWVMWSGRVGGSGLPVYVYICIYMYILYIHTHICTYI
jgi:hypothetical protein